MTDVASMEQTAGQAVQIKENADTSALAQKQSHITLLPPDILRLIFEHATATQGRRGPLWKFDWMRNTAHVCASWRSIALDHAAFWTYIDLNAPMWVVDKKLNRSKEAPLTMIINMSRRHMKDLERAWKHTSRIRDLSIIAETDYQDAWYPVLVKNILPNTTEVAQYLESFSLTFKQGDRPNDSLSANIFAGGTPNLRKLQLRRCDLDWNSPFLTGLTILSLIKPGSKTGRPSLTQLITVLETMSNLETLVLHDVLPPAFGNPISSPRRTKTLPRLASIDIISTTLECTRFLQYFVFPSIDSAKFSLISGPSEFAANYADIMTNIYALATEGGLFLRHPIRSIDCQYLHDYHELEIVLWDTCGDHPYRRRAGSPWLQLTVELSDKFPRSWQVEILGSLSKMLPLEEIQSLSISQISPTDVDWASCIHQFKSLRWLYARDTRTSYKFMDDLFKQSLTYFYDDLSEEEEEYYQRSSVEEQEYLPVLQGFLIKDCSFTRAGGPEQFGLLSHCLQIRARRQHPLTSLHLIRCTISDDQVSLLKKTVPNIIVAKRGGDFE